MSRSQKILERMKISMHDFDPNGTAAVEVSWTNVRDIQAIAVAFFRTIGTGDITLKIMGNSASDGSGTDVDIVTKTVSAQPDAVGDQIFLECSAAEIAAAAEAAGETVQYVTAVVSAGASGDEGVILQIVDPVYVYEAQTADVVA